LYCITYINSNTPDIDKVFEEISKFGKYSTVITNCAEFLEKVKKSIPTAEMELVRYGEKGETYSVFDKDKNYIYQNEFRIVKNSNGGSDMQSPVGILYVDNSRYTNTNTIPNVYVLGIYENEVQYLKSWLIDRMDWMKAQFDRM
jgi:hypothetical protein